jgi:putative N-acetyltransferase (TIGR04045 family)
MEQHMTAIQSFNALAFCELPQRFAPAEFRICWADGPWMQREAQALRHQVFCVEQGLFGGAAGSDTDEIDRHGTQVHTLAALSCQAGQYDELVGTVRIHEAAPGLWWGSRLAISRRWRGQAQLGSALIRLAVSSAHALGCREFLAHVQAQNVPLFERLHWHAHDRMDLHGRPHALMGATLAHYPPCHTPYTGFVLTPEGRS